MNATLERLVASALLAIHAFLLAWGLVGFVEWFSASVPWARVSNPLFPPTILLLQWTLVVIAGGVFLGGFASRWRHLPIAMAGIYAAMAMLCAVETFGYMVSDTRFVAMALEYAAYLAILVYLDRSPRFRAA